MSSFEYTTEHLNSLPQMDCHITVVHQVSDQIKRALIWEYVKKFKGIILNFLLPLLPKLSEISIFVHLLSIHLCQKKNLYICMDIENVIKLTEKWPIRNPFPLTKYLRMFPYTCTINVPMILVEIVYFDTLQVNLSTFFIELGQKSLVWVSCHSTVVFCSLHSNGYINPDHLFYFL